MNPLTGQTVLITGASSGIGREFAWIFARAGHPVVLLARSRDKLEVLARAIAEETGQSALALDVDLAESGASQRVQAELEKRHLGIDILVNNAGFGLHGNHATLEESRQRDLLQVNVMALMQLTRMLLPAMLRRGRGGVLNVASTAAFQAGPHMALYYASKAFVLSFSEALHDEVAGSGVHVSCLCPGPTDTAFSAQAGMENVPLFNLGVHSARTVARAGYEALLKNRSLAIVGPRNQAMAFATRLVPRWVSRRIAMRLNG